MRRFSIFSRALAAAVILAWAARAGAEDPPAAKTGGPRIVFEKETMDAGDVVRGSSATVNFVVRNTGDEVLKILSAKPG